MSLAEENVDEEIVAALRGRSQQEVDAFLDALDADQVEAMEAAVTRHEIGTAEWRETPATMANYLTNGRFRLYRYARLLGEKFREGIEGKSKRQIWELPPRYGKSLQASQWGPAWTLDRFPWFKWILSSYGDSLAVENAIGVRDILREHRGELRTQLRADRQQRDRFVTREGGGVLAAGIRSAITGFGAHGVVFDDPYKDWIEASSATRRKEVETQFRAVLLTRLENEDAFVLVVMTRWHQEDIAGSLQESTGVDWDVTRIPELAEVYLPESPDRLLRVPDPLGRAPGEPIEPERFSLGSIRQKHAEMGSFLTAAMFQQRPAPEEGDEIKRKWFRLDDNVPVEADEWITSWDMKLKERETGDYVVGQTWARTGSSFWLTSQLRGQWNQPTTENAIALAAVRQPRCRLHVIENTGNGPEVLQAIREPKPGYVVSDEVADLLGMNAEERAAVQELRRRGIPNAVPENVKGSKVVRMRAHSGILEAGRVHLSAHADFVPAFLDEVTAFPNGAHDDIVDSMSQALRRLHGGAATVRVPQGDIPPTPISQPSNARPVVRPNATVSRVPPGPF